MSIRRVREEISRFLRSPSPEVLAIKGRWGVGKTFEWEKAVRAAQECQQLPLEKYSYVSLFGVGDLKDLRRALFEQSIERGSIGKPVGVESLENGIKRLIQSRGKLGVFSLLGAFSKISAFTPLIETLCFLSVNKTLVCIDDLERKGAGLEIRDVMGLVSLLKERKECKVALIFNEGESELGDYQKYSEKVVDVELEFAPTPEECADIALGTAAKNSELIQVCCSKLGITNIRLIRLASRLAASACSETEGLRSEIDAQIVKSLVLFVWCRHRGNDPQIPPLEYVTSTLRVVTAWDEKTKKTEEELLWDSLLQKYGHGYSDELDRILANGVRAGYFDRVALKDEAERKDAALAATHSVAEFRQAWELFHESFDDNREVLLTGLEKSFATSVPYLSLGSVDSTVRLFRELGEDERADRLIQVILTSADERRVDISRQRFVLADKVTDPRLGAALEEYLSRELARPSLSQVVEKLSTSSGWNPDDEEVLDAATVEDFVGYFKSDLGGRLTEMVGTCLRFGRISNATDRHKRIGEKVRIALEQIGSESELNRLRVAKYGVRVGGEEGTSESDARSTRND